jgi:hypothetical protein
MCLLADKLKSTRRAYLLSRALLNAILSNTILRNISLVTASKTKDFCDKGGKYCL